MSADIVIVMNPRAGGGRMTEAIRAEAAQRRGLALRETSGPDDLATLAAEAADHGATTIVAAGGDGTIHAVVNALSDRLDAVQLGVIPCGSANDLATALAIPFDPAAALDLIERRGATPIDLIRAESGGEARLVCNGVSGGFGDTVDRKLDEAEGKTLGGWSYLVAALSALGEVAMHELVLDVDDERLTCRSPAVVLGNGRRVGGVMLAPEARLDDGRCDFGAVTAESLLDRAALAAMLAVGEHLNHDALIFRRARRVAIDAEPSMRFRCDGEAFGRTPMTFTVLPAALRLIRPAPPTG